MSDKIDTHWTLAQIVLWICTQDLDVVGQIEKDIEGIDGTPEMRISEGLRESPGTLFMAIDLISKKKPRTLVGAHEPLPQKKIPDLIAGKEPPSLDDEHPFGGAPDWPHIVSGPVAEEILESGREGTVTFYGTTLDSGDRQKIKPCAFRGLFIQALPDGFRSTEDHPHPMWKRVFAKSADVIGRWPSLDEAEVVEAQDGSASVGEVIGEKSCDGQHLESAQSIDDDAMVEQPASSRPPMKKEVEALYLARVEEHWATKGRRPTIKEDEKWARDLSIPKPRDRVRELRREHSTPEQRIGGRPKEAPS